MTTATVGPAGRVATEHSLDPADWEEVRALAHSMLDEMVDYQRDVREGPVWTRPTPAARAAYAAPLPRAGVGLEATLASFRDHIRPHVLGNAHPRFWGWVCGTGTPTGMLADMLASGMNAHAAFGDQAATHIERQVIAWCAELIGYPSQASGLLVTSGSIAEITAMIVARDATFPGIHQSGVRAAATQPVVYASTQVHNSLDKAIGIIGLGRDNIRKVPVDEHYRMRLDALDEAITADARDGKRPFCVVASAGTVNTGATDDLRTIAQICQAHKLWLHVDAAFGIGLAASKVRRAQLAGIEQADSVSFDFHKWFHVPYDAACTLIRVPEAHRISFAPAASYLAPLDGGIPSGGTHYGELGMDLSRSFRALKVWMTFMHYGVDRLGLMVDQNIAQARYLSRLVETHPRLRLAAPVPLNIVNFRYVGEGLDDEASDGINRRIITRLHESGVAVPSHTVIDGRFVIRVAITNHRTQREDLDTLVREVVAIGIALESGYQLGGTNQAARKEAH